MAVRCVHPIVTLLEKLDALHRRVPRQEIDPATFVRLWLPKTSSGRLGAPVGSPGCRRRAAGVDDPLQLQRATWHTTLSHMAHFAEAALDENKHLLELLGGRKTLGFTPRNDSDYIDLVRRGLPFMAFRRVTEELALTFKDVQDSLHLSTRTLHRRKDERLTPVESERVMRLARIASRALQFFEDRETALDWLMTSNRALAGQKPLDLLDTDLGADQVLEVLGRLEFGLYT